MRAPTMFQRRLLLIAGALAAGFVLLGGQLYRVTMIQGGAWRAAAERALVDERWIATTRGRIVDRHGRVLAADRPAYDVLVDYPLINGSWALDRAVDEAREAAGEDWGELGPWARDGLVRTRMRVVERELDGLWDELAELLGAAPEELTDRRIDIVRRVQRMTSHVHGARLAARWEAYRERGARGPAPTASEVAAPIAEQVAPHAIAESVDEETAYAVRRMAARHPWLSVQPSGDRDYPLETVLVDVETSSFPAPLRDVLEPVVVVEVRGVASHVLGWMTAARAEHVEARPVKRPDGEIDRGGYRPGDPVGAAGIERGYEPVLRGVRGRIVQRKDTGIRRVTEAEPGRDVELTIDASLQARIQALFDPALGLAVVQPWQAQPAPEAQPVGTPLAGAVVVLDVETREVLALASAPSFTRQDLVERPSWVFGNPAASPVTNRAVGKPYPPGSIVKPMILAAAVTEGVHSLDHLIECTGHLLPNAPYKYRCWMWKRNDQKLTHRGASLEGLTGAEAIAGSCNIYFYSLGRALGGRRITTWYERFGLRRPFDLGVGTEFEGWIGRRGEGGAAEPVELSEATLMGMGQGPVAWTPLHAANAYATLAGQGRLLSPRLVRGARPRVDDLRLDLDATDAALEGLRRVMLPEHRGTAALVDWGTGRREPLVAMDGVTVWGKTGTAQAPSIIADPDGDGPEPVQTLRRGDHSWFVLLCAPEGRSARYAVAVVVDYGGSGGRVAGPIANQVLRALRAEGYL